jgi:hypothetical protein
LDGRGALPRAARLGSGRSRGAALLIGDRRAIAVTETSIAIETLSGSQLKFRRIGREHLA